MRRGLSAMLVLSLAAGCKKDEPEAIPVQQPAAAETKAPAPATKSSTQQGTAPRPATPNPAAVAAAELAAAPRVRTVQVGAYPEAAGAKWWVAELQRQGIPAYTVTTTVARQEVTRLRIGAALTGAEARAVAERIHARYKWPTWITMVDDRSPLPANALSATRAYVAAK